jgi:hypothetical protein
MGGLCISSMNEHEIQRFFVDWAAIIDSMEPCGLRSQGMPRIGKVLISVLNWPCLVRNIDEHKNKIGTSRPIVVAPSRPFTTLKCNLVLFKVLSIAGSKVSMNLNSTICRRVSKWPALPKPR